MKITYVTQSTELWGGICVVFQHLEVLAAAGHEVFLSTPANSPDWYPLNIPIHSLQYLDPAFIPPADIIVATSWATIQPVVESQKGIPVHLCQGLEGEYKELGPHKASIEAAYAYDIPKLTVAPHLYAFLKNRFKGETYYVGQMLDRGVFYPLPKPEEHTDAHEPFSILVVGPFQVDFKNIATALQGIRLAKERLNRPVRVIRVSQFPLSDEETDIVKPDSYHFHVPYPKMGHFYREADLFISMSKEAEGFGLPAIEAMSCGTPTILSNISSYADFDTAPDYALFVDPDDPQTLADAIVDLSGNRSLRKALIHKGLRVAAQFNRESLRDRLIEAFTAILQTSSLPRTTTV